MKGEVLTRCRVTQGWLESPARSLFGLILKVLSTMSSSGGASGPTRVSEYPTAPVGGSEAAEIAIFATCLSIFFLYHVYYYKRHVLLRHWWLSRAQKTLAMDLWTTAVESRILWTREMINQPQEGDSLLAVHTMRYFFFQPEHCVRTALTNRPAPPRPAETSPSLPPYW